MIVGVRRPVAWPFLSLVWVIGLASERGVPLFPIFLGLLFLATPFASVPSREEAPGSR